MRTSTPNPAEQATQTGPSLRGRHRLAHVVGLGISVVVHVVLLQWPLVPLGSHGRSSGDPTPPIAPSGMEVVRLSTRPSTPERVADPVERTEPTIESPAVTDPPTRTAEAATAAPGDSIPSSPSSNPRLTPSLSNAALWGPIPWTVEDDFALELDVMRTEVRRWNRRRASAPVVVEGMAAWSVAAEEGSVWGATPGTLHLGRVVVPTCGGSGANAADCGFGLLPTKRLEYNALLSKVREIDRQAARFEIERTWRERADAIRARHRLSRPDSVPHGPSP